MFYLILFYCVIGTIVSVAINTAFSLERFSELRGMKPFKKAVILHVCLLIVAFTWPVWVGYYVGARIKRK